MASVGVRLMQKVSSTMLFAKIAPHVIPALDKAVHRLTRGKVILSAQMLPGVILTAKGARSGLPRTTPLACMPEGDGASWLLIGSNFGRPGHPAWTGNLIKYPDAEVSWRGRDIAVRARLLQGEERAAAWQAALRFWPPYATYQARIEREIRLFRLERR
ncbi:MULTISPECIES: nitroreductase family deazaflavin-dependent oxidoreductase [unclassified Streptomyces]|uniref:nitroreductase family deazaflavin-dependent oxidoreductase n=1 Tax=unclassified Streptomyces TaxID=2593676 RepID=UPI00226E783A|nr:MULTISPECIES: nitroreductase family deazaflavin-dependent oxidoreductase [unclassified Streptomyces]MCY0916888.1 nitroreductase family deazaflavin-dependent oxidoreductase [Streptomyces sp. H27-G5]MCY0958044.1 nitroreductase family deazaflavin-dependent oxidoreductase [Streptomyces sp. H27-H5]